MMMMACTPSSLRVGKAPEEVKIDDVVSVPELSVPELSVAEISVPEMSVPEQSVDSVSLPALIDSISDHQEVDSLIAEIKDSIEAHPEIIPVDTLIPANLESAIKTKRDTTTMDSLELAIYKYNKVVDDSLARDSINKRRKNGIESPVEYAANDSLVYEAGLSRAYL